MQMEVLSVIIIFIFGLSIGSFLNVVIDRLPQGLDVVQGRSKCDFCQRELESWELVPVLSFIFLRGRCRTCHKKLSMQYPIIELLTGITFAVFFLFYSPPPTIFWLIYWLIFIAGLIALSIIDLKTGLILDEIVIFLIGIFAIWSLGELSYLVLTESNPILVWLGNFIPHLAAGSLAALFFYSLIAISNGRWMGGGDVRLAFLIGLFLSGWATFLAIYLAFVLGGVVAIALLLIGHKKFGQTIPFGPFLGLGAFIALIWGERLIEFYLSLFR